MTKAKNKIIMGYYEEKKVDDKVYKSITKDCF